MYNKPQQKTIYIYIYIYIVRAQKWSLGLLKIVVLGISGLTQLIYKESGLAKSNIMLCMIQVWNQWSRDS